MPTISTPSTQQIPISEIKSGVIHCKVAAPDYRLKAGHDYKVHVNNGVPCIFVGGIFDTEQIDLSSIRTDVLAGLEWVASE